MFMREEREERVDNLILIEMRDKRGEINDYYKIKS